MIRRCIGKVDRSCRSTHPWCTSRTSVRWIYFNDLQVGLIQELRVIPIRFSHPQLHIFDVEKSRFKENRGVRCNSASHPQSTHTPTFPLRLLKANNPNPSVATAACRAASPRFDLRPDIPLPLYLLRYWDFRLLPPSSLPPSLANLPFVHEFCPSSHPPRPAQPAKSIFVTTFGFALLLAPLTLLYTLASLLISSMLR